MQPGKLDQRVTIEQQQKTRDSQYNSDVVSWVPLVALPGSPTLGAKFWAEVQDVLPSKDETQTQDLRIVKARARMRMRYRADIDSTMRVVLHLDSGDVTYQMVSEPATLGRKEMIEIMLERVSS